MDILKFAEHKNHLLIAFKNDGESDWRIGIVDSEMRPRAIFAGDKFYENVVKYSRDKFNTYSDEDTVKEVGKSLVSDFKNQVNRLTSKLHSLFQSMKFTDNELSNNVWTNIPLGFEVSSNRTPKYNIKDVK